MKSRKVKLNKTVFDTFVFSFILIFTSGLFLLINKAFKTNEDLYVYAFVKNRLIDKKALDIDMTMTYNEPEFLAPITLEIKDSKVRVEKEESPLNYCSIKGFTNQIADPVMCLPNSFYFIIMGVSYKEAPVPYVPSI